MVFPGLPASRQLDDARATADVETGPAPVPKPSRRRCSAPAETMAATSAASSRAPRIARPEEAELGARRRSEEVAFLEHGLHEVQRAAQIVYTENMDLRARLELVTNLTSRLAGISGLPEDVRSELRLFLDCAVPPLNAIEPGYAGKEDDLQSMRGATGAASFAARMKELCKALDRHELSRSGSSGHEQQDACASAAAPPHGAPDRPCSGNEAQGAMLAITEYGENVWTRAQMVCKEFLEGWFD
mmetsp:Transcript_148345/g.413246  ORF Transcript_148345/g.413246 Transcript_148345/m.413246 type:complete len:244 (-) Transcript_148345:121-852(-)